MLVLLPACSGAGAVDSPAATVPVATATSGSAIPAATPTKVVGAPTVVAATATTSAAPTSTPSAAATVGGAAPTPASNQLAQGKLIFEKTAGGVGCAYCHGLDAKGNGPAKNNAPDIRSKTEADIRAAVAGGVPVMSIVKLTEAEFEAVAAYLATLNK